MKRPMFRFSAYIHVVAVLMVALVFSEPGSAQPQNDDDPFAIPLSALAPENLNRERPPAPFDLTGNWFVDLNATPSAWRFGPPYPELTPAAQAHFDAGRAAVAEGKVYRDDIGQCWPAGMPLIMTRVWPMAMI